MADDGLKLTIDGLQDKHLIDLAGILGQAGGTPPASPTGATANPASLPLAGMGMNRYASMSPSVAAPMQTNMKHVLGSVKAVPADDSTPSFYSVSGPQSTLGKFGSVLGRIGKAVGTDAAIWGNPKLAPEIPGTRQFNEREEALGEKKALNEATVGHLGAESELEKAQAGKINRPEAAGDTAAQTVTSGDQAYEWNPDTKRYDIPIGSPKAQKAETGKPDIMAFGSEGKEYVIGPNGQPTPVMLPPTQVPETGIVGQPGHIPATQIAAQQATAFEKPGATKNTKEQLEAQINDAITSYGKDSPQVKSLQDRMKSIDPEGQQKINVSVGNQGLARERTDFERQKMGFDYNPDLLSDKERSLLPVDDQGNPINLKSPLAPTAMTKNSAQTAKTVGTLLDDTLAILKNPKLKEELGPYKGRINEIMAGTIGAGNPDFVELRTLGAFDSSGMLKVHFGSRGGTAMYDHFKNLLDTGKMDVPTLISSLNAMKKVTGAYSGEIKTGRTGGASVGGPKVGDVEGGYRFKGGAPHDKANWEKVK